MSTSPIGPEDVRAAAEVHRELGPEYSDAVVAAFIERVDREVAARVEARLAAGRPNRPARRERRALLKGMVIGACGSAIALAGLGLAVVHAHDAGRAPVTSVPYEQQGRIQVMPYYNLGQARIVPAPHAALP
jgi:hypothetical protein